MRPKNSQMRSLPPSHFGRLVVSLTCVTIVLVLNGALAATAGEVKINSVILDALGAKHGYAEYVIDLTGTKLSADPITLLELDYTTGESQSAALAEPVVVNFPKTEGEQIANSARLALIIDGPRLRSVTIRYSTIDRATSTVENDETQYTISKPKLTTPLRFDDTAPWVGSLPSVFPFVIPSPAAAGSSQPDDSGFPKVAEVTMLVDLDVDGNVVDVEVTSSSGIRMFDDKAVDIERNMKYSPASLITPLGMVRTPSRLLVVTEFVNDRPSQ